MTAEDGPFGLTLHHAQPSAGPTQPRMRTMVVWCVTRKFRSRLASGARKLRRSGPTGIYPAGRGSVLTGQVAYGASGARPAPEPPGRLEPMGAVETMEDFFERLNAGDRNGAVSLMDERAEMRVHVMGNVRTLRGVDEVGGWFLRADKGLRMIPGGVRETGNTYEADLLVLRPGAQSQHLDATFRVEAGRITAINLTPR